MPKITHCLELIAKPFGNYVSVWKILKNPGLVPTLLFEAEGFAITSLNSDIPILFWKTS